MKWRTGDTITAVATPPGIGGVGIVRVSGPAATASVAAWFRSAHGAGLAEAPSHRLIYGWIEAEGRTVDEVMAVRMAAPHSYTCEDVVEVHCHGGPVAVRTILELICRAGARAAEPGEFTFRAFVNGRLDLTQVEAVGDLVRAGSRVGLEVSANQLRGRLHEAISGIRDDVRHVAALVAASIDFPEEGEVFTHAEDCRQRLGGAAAALDDLLATADRGRMLREGLAVAIVGRPNVGKSSLLNALLRESRAIVTEIPGTTRDTVEEIAEVQGLAIRLIDTAGIRHTADRVEQAGIDRSRQAVARADLTLLVMDGAAPLEEGDRLLLTEVPPTAALVVVNKRDLMEGDAPPWADAVADYPRLSLSAHTGAGLDELERWIAEWALADEAPLRESALITNLRQKDAAGRARQAIGSAQRALEAGMGEELLAVDLGRALDALGDIVGETTAEDLLDSIFAEFCIGK